MAATRSPQPRPLPHTSQGGAAPVWLVVHGLHDAAAPALAAALGAAARARGVRVQAVSVAALMAGVRWWLCVTSDGTACTLEATGLALQAGPTGADGAAHEDAALGARTRPRDVLAGVVNRCGPVVLPVGVPDADYKSAEWNALLLAWLQGLPCAVINRPSPHNLQVSTMGPARWRQAAAAHGLPIWPLQDHQAWRHDEGEVPGLLVMGQQVFEALTPWAPRWPAPAHHAAAAAAADLGCDLLAWNGSRDAAGQWRVSGATPWPDLRHFEPAAATALAQALSQPPSAPP